MSAPSSTYFVQPLAGSSKYLVYARYPQTGHRASTTGGLFVTTRHGHAQRLGRALPYITGVSLAGHMVVYVQGSAKHRVKWWNLATGEHGSVTAPSQTALAASPTGWIVTLGADQPDSTLANRTPTGAVTSLTSTYTYGLGPVGANRLIARGPHVLEAAMRYSDAGTFRPVIPGDFLTKQFASGGDLTCRSMNKTTLACRALPDSGAVTYAEVLAPLDQGKVVYTARHAQNMPAAFGRSIAWVGRSSAGCTRSPIKKCSGPLYALSRSGRLASSRRSYDALDDPVSAFGGVVVRSTDHHDLYLIKQIGTAPHAVLEG